MAFLDSGVQPLRRRRGDAVPAFDADLDLEPSRHDFDAAFVREAIRELKPLYARMERVITPIEWAAACALHQGHPRPEAREERGHPRA